MWPTTIDILLRVVLGWTFAMLQYLISSEQLAEHDSEILSFILMRYSVSSPTVSWVQAHRKVRLTHLSLKVVVGAVFLLAISDTIASCNFIVVWVIFFLFPAMAVDTTIL